ncbi:tetraspanin family protein [Microbacterium foliorum]
MKKSLTRSIGFWLLLVFSLASAGVGGWLIAGQIGTMTSTLLDGTATGIEVYVGQSLVVVGAALLGAGVIGILVAVALSAVQALLPSPAPVVVEPIDGDTESDAADDETTMVENSSTHADAEQIAEDDEAQNGSSGSTATATKISVK